MRVFTTFVMVLAVAATATTTTSCMATPAQDKEPPRLACEMGPLQKTYGGTEWVVYSCSDDRTVVIHSAAGNPAMPFYFIFFQQDGRLQLQGEGTGDKKYTEAAFKELEPMTAQAVAALVRETKAVKNGTAGQ